MEQSVEQLLRYLRAAWRRRWIGVAVAWIACLSGWAGVHFIPDRYEAHARLYVDADAVLTPLLRGIAVDVSSSEQLQVLQRTLLSRPNLDTLISKTDLGLAATTASQRELLVRQLATKIKVGAGENSNLFSIEYQNSNPQLARDVVQALLSIFTESATGSNRREMENAQVFLQHQIASYEQQLHQMEERRAVFRAKYAGMLPIDGVSGSVNSVETARDTVSKLELQLQDEQAKEAQIKKSLEHVPQMLPGGPFAAGGAAAGMSPLAQAEAHLRELQSLYTDDYPGVIEQKALVEEMRRSSGGRGEQIAETGGIPNQVFEQLTLRLVDIQSEISSLQRQLSAADGNLARITQVQRDQPALLAEYENLNRDYGVLRKSYDELVGRMQAATISQAADTQADKVHLRVVDPPEIPLLPVGPNRPLLMTGVLIVGLAAGVGVAVLITMIDRSFATIADLRALGLPVLGGLSVVGALSARRRVLAITHFAGAIVLLIGLYGGLLLRLMSAGHAA